MLYKTKTHKQKIEIEENVSVQIKIIRWKDFYSWYKDEDGNPTYDDDTTDVDTGDVESWIHEGGLLLTHDRLFNGCEADLVIIVSTVWGGTATTNIRSGVTRAVADVCVLMSDDGNTDVEKLTQTFNVEDIRRDDDKVMKSASAATSPRKKSKCNIL